MKATTTVNTSKLAPLDNQPYLEVAILDVPVPGRALMLPDTGAAFTMVTEGFVRRHKIEMRPYHTTFTQADPTTSGKIVGKVDLML